MFIKEYLIIKISGLFDKNYYLKNYIDVKDSNTDPITHYIKYGWKEGKKNPSEKFDTNFYLETYPDVKKVDINPLFHYIKNGKKRKNDKH